MSSAPLLQGLRVVEVAVLFNGDFTGMLLGDLGADVVKVESPTRGDYIRDMLGRVGPGNSLEHLHVNRNKRSITLDLSSPEGRDIFLSLIDTADVVVDGNVAGALDRLGLGVATLRARKPDLIYCQVTGFGTGGPYESVPTHGGMMNALAGAAPHVRGEDGGAEPAPDEGHFGGISSGAKGSVAAGMFAVQYVLAALVRRERTGVGAVVDVSGSEAVIATAWQAAMHQLNSHLVTDHTVMPRSDASGRVSTPKHGYYETADERFVELGAIEPKFWRRFCAAVDRPDLLDDRTEAVDFTVGEGDEARRLELRTVFRTKTCEEWMVLAAEHQIPIAPALGSVTEALCDPHLLTRDIVVRGRHPAVGDLLYVGRPALVDDAHFAVERPAPALGADSDDILAELGYATAAISKLRADGVV